MKVLLLDNFDSFTYNLLQLLKETGDHDCRVVNHLEVTVAMAMEYDAIMLSPGPGLPATSGKLLEVVRACAPLKDILGICLGHQAIAEVFGAKLAQLEQPLHGYTTTVSPLDRQHILFKGLPEAFPAGLYHSWYVTEDHFPDGLKITAKSSENYIMSISHVQYRVHGLQFHPESVMSPWGKDIISNWLGSVAI